jgi:hypothetical protein
MGTIAEKLQRTVEGKQYVIDKVNIKAQSNLKINSTWKSIGDTIENISGGSGGAVTKYTETTFSEEYQGDIPFGNENTIVQALVFNNMNDPLLYYMILRAILYDLNGLDTAILFADENLDAVLGIQYDPLEDIVSINVNNSFVVFAYSSDNPNVEDIYGFNGFNPDFITMYGNVLYLEMINIVSYEEFGYVFYGDEETANVFRELISALLVDVSENTFTKQLSGEYDGTPISQTSNGVIDIGELLKQGKLPLKIKIQV